MLLLQEWRWQIRADRCDSFLPCKRDCRTRRSIVLVQRIPFPGSHTDWLISSSRGTKPVMYGLYCGGPAMVCASMLLRRLGQLSTREGVSEIGCWVERSATVSGCFVSPSRPISICITPQKFYEKLWLGDYICPYSGFLKQYYVSRDPRCS